jgi:hypothetical protein
MKSDVKTCEDNTKPEFFARWSLRDLQVECARLNKVLKEIRRELAKLDDELAPPNTKH